MVQCKIVRVFLLLYLLPVLVDEIASCTEPAGKKDKVLSEPGKAVTVKPLKDWPESERSTNLIPTDNLCADGAGQIYEM